MYSTLVHTGNGQPFVAEHLQTAEEVLANVELLQEGWKSLRDPKSARVEVSWNVFFREVLRCACGREEAGTVVLFKSKNLKPLGFMVLFDDSGLCDKRRLHIFAGYSNGKYLNAPVASLVYVKHWAKEHGYEIVSAQTGRINGAAMRLFRKKLGFRPLAMLFETEV
jgi:hypothetical protein